MTPSDYFLFIVLPLILVSLFVAQLPALLRYASTSPSTVNLPGLVVEDVALVSLSRRFRPGRREAKVALADGTLYFFELGLLPYALKKHYSRAVPLIDVVSCARLGRLARLKSGWGFGMQRAIYSLTLADGERLRLQVDGGPQIQERLDARCQSPPAGA